LVASESGAVAEAARPSQVTAHRIGGLAQPAGGGTPAAWRCCCHGNVVIDPLEIGEAKAGPAAAPPLAFACAEGEDVVIEVEWTLSPGPLFIDGANIPAHAVARPGPGWRIRIWAEAGAAQSARAMAAVRLFGSGRTAAQQSRGGGETRIT
jgi:hypothetical protein